MQPRTPGPVPKDQEIREPKKSYPTIEMDANGPEFNSENKQSQVQATDDQGQDKNQAPEVNDGQKAP